MPEVDPVEHADDREQRAVLRRAGPRPRRRRRSRPQPSAARVAGSASTRTLSGARRPSRTVAIATRRPAPSRTRIGASGSPGGSAARMNWPREIAVTSPSVIDELRQRRRGPRRSGGAALPARPALRRRLPERARAGSPRSSRNGPLDVRLSAPRYAPLPTSSPRSRASARMYVPAEHSTSRIAIGRSGSESSHSTRSSRWIVTSRDASSTDSPALAIAYARRPATLIALYAGGRCEIGPRRRSRAASTVVAIGRRPPRPASARPRDRRSSTWRRSRPSPGSPSGPRGDTRRRGSPGRGRAAARRSRTDRASRRDPRASSPRAGERGRRCRATSGQRASGRREFRPRPAQPSGRRRRRVARPRRGRRAVPRRPAAGSSRRPLARVRRPRTRRSARSRRRRRASSGR